MSDEIANSNQFKFVRDKDGQPIKQTYTGHNHPFWCCEVLGEEQYMKNGDIVWIDDTRYQILSIGAYCINRDQNTLGQRRYRGGEPVELCLATLH